MDSSRDSYGIIVPGRIAVPGTRRSPP
jgi:hypothetical protein